MRLYVLLGSLVAGGLFVLGVAVERGERPSPPIVASGTESKVLADVPAPVPERGRFVAEPGPVRPLVETAPHLPPAAPATAPLPEPAEIPKRDVPPPVAQPVHVPVPVARPVQRVQVPAPAQRSVELAKREKSAEAMLEDMLAPPKRDHGCGGCHAENAEVRRHPLLLAAALGQDDRVRQIVASGVAVDRPEGTKRRTALECAIQNRRVTTVELLLSLGANPNRKTSRGARPLDEATLGKIYRTLVAHGAEPAQKPGPNDTPDILGMIFTSGR